MWVLQSRYHTSQSIYSWTVVSSSSPDSAESDVKGPYNPYLFPGKLGEQEREISGYDADMHLNRFGLIPTSDTRRMEKIAPTR